MSKKSFDKRRAEETNQEEQILNEKNNSETIRNEREAAEEKNTDEAKEAKETDSANKENAAEKPEAKEETNTEIENLNNKLLRLQADYLNYKNRTEKEKLSTYGNAVADVIQDLLNIVDNLERALKIDTPIDNSFKDGIQMIYEQLMGVLDKRGLKEIEALHKPFDHNVHYGVAFDAESDKEEGTIIEVFQKGYTVNNKVIRPSMVKIAKK